MSNKPVLVIMAAGMGSRFGGLKQIEGMGPNGEVIIDYSLYDAKRAGFDTVICIIKKEIEDDFKKVMEKGAARHLNILYAYQDIDDIPKGFEVPKDRVKPWGTSHAILAARKLIDGPFALINADDYYGVDVYKTMYNFLSQAEDKKGIYDFAMMGYKLKNTMSFAGTVARGVCVEENGYLKHIDERLKIGYINEGIGFTEDDGQSWTMVDGEAVVSMNFFGFTKSIIKELEDRFPKFLKEEVPKNPLKAEYLIPKVTGQLVEEKKASVKILPAEDKWFGVTYREDKDNFVVEINRKIAEGVYPKDLWG